MPSFQQQFRQAWQKLLPQFLPEHWSVEQHERCLEKLLHAYQEPQRAYHSLQHIVECLALFEIVQSQIEDALAVQLAIFFHDVVYQPRSASNEQESALLMRQQLAGALPETQLDKIVKWILATQQHAVASESDLAYLLDIDPFDGYLGTYSCMVNNCNDNCLSGQFRFQFLCQYSLYFSCKSQC